MIVFRLAKAQYANDLSGRGAEMAGGRWNSIGTPLIYCGDSRALCTAEIAVHTPFGIMPKNYNLIEIEIPDNSITVLNNYDIPYDWNTFPHSFSTQKIGDEFVMKNKFLVLKVPSAVIQGDFNLLINPLHRDFAQVKILKIENFGFDKRLFKIND